MKTFSTLAGELGMAVGGRGLPPGDHPGARLAALRVRLGFGRRVAANLAGISPTTVAAVEGGAACHTAAVVGLARALGVSLRLVPVGVPEAFWTSVAASTVHHGWHTPPAVLEALYGVVGPRFDLDPCSPVRKGPKAPVRARIRFTFADDALALPWRADTVFMNPPYGRALAAWVAKAREEHGGGRAKLIIALIPARPDTGWWHEHVARTADAWMLRGRLAFGDGTQAAPFPSAIVAWGATEEQRARLTAAFPRAWHVGRAA